MGGRLTFQPQAQLLQHRLVLLLGVVVHRVFQSALDTLKFADEVQGHVRLAGFSRAFDFRLRALGLDEFASGMCPGGLPGIFTDSETVQNRVDGYRQFDKRSKFSHPCLLGLTHME